MAYQATTSGKHTANNRSIGERLLSVRSAKIIVGVNPKINPNSNRIFNFVFGKNSIISSIIDTEENAYINPMIGKKVSGIAVYGFTKPNTAISAASVTENIVSSIFIIELSF